MVVVRQIEINTTEQLILVPSIFEVSIAIPKLNRNVLQCSEQIPAELIQVGGETLLSEIHKLVNSIWNEEEMWDQ
jgi:hypothetical protein